ncbi:hypothetical protein AC579_5566 [Pseudocercospora musae]|uniref:Uncharacterized protein n=1 Tax=Pseudocercospora musae TaxID=113226 RepID=A0A139I913_9PEZI|nr:hypothetical protein AC579_5566 [Pseudocercospora musae]
MLEEHELIVRPSPAVAAQVSEQEASGLIAVIGAQQDSQAPSIACNTHGNSVEERMDSDTAALLMSHCGTNNQAEHQSTDSLGNSDSSSTNVSTRHPS